MKKFNIFNLGELIPFYIFLVILSGILFYYNKIIGVIALIVTAFLLIYEIRNLSDKEEQLENYMENFNDKFDEITRRAIFSMPFPLAILNHEGKIIWHNTNLKTMVDEEEPVLNLFVNEVFPEVDVNN